MGQNSDGVTKIRHKGVENLRLVSYRSADMSLNNVPPIIKSNHSINIERRKTISSGVVYRGKTAVCQNYDWVLAWADKDDHQEKVYTQIRDPVPAYTDEVWEAIFAMVRRSGSPSYFGHMDYVAEAHICNAPCQQSVVEAKIMEAVTDGITIMRNETRDNFLLVSFRSEDLKLNDVPSKIRSNGCIKIERGRTSGSAIVYRDFNDKYDWVLAWANEHGRKERVYTIIQPPVSEYTDTEWITIFTKLLNVKPGSSCSSTCLGYEAEANIPSVKGYLSVVNAKIKHVGC